MKKILSSFSLLLCFGVITASADADPSVVSIQVQLAKLRSGPKQFAASVADVKFGDAVTVLSKDSGWFKVRLSNGTEGFIHESAVTQKKIVLSSQQVSLADVAVDETQVYLAGKGFNADVEKFFVAQGKGSDYTAVDAMQNASSTSGDRTAVFIRGGKLIEE